MHSTTVSTLFVVFVSSFIGCQQTPPVRGVKRYTAAQFLKTTSIFGSSFSHNEKLILYSSDASGIFNAYAVPINGGDPTQLTYSTQDSIFAVSFFPHDDRVLYRADTGGNEIFHLYVREEDGGTRDLTPGDRNRALFRGWSTDGKSLYYESNQRDARFMDLYEMDVTDFHARMIFRNDEGYSFGGISEESSVKPVSPDGRYLAFHKEITRDNSDIYLYDRTSQQVRHLSTHQGDVNFIPMVFTPDSKGLYYLTDLDSEFLHLWRFELNSGSSKKIEAPKWDVTSASLSASGQYLVIEINNDGRTETRVYETSTHRRIPLPDLREGDITSVRFSKSERLMAFYQNSSKSPGSLYIHDLQAGKHSKLVDAMNPEIDPQDLVETEIVRYKSFDGMEIPAILMKPHLALGEKAPALVQVHGGPGGQSRIGYDAEYQHLVNHGYVILRVNNRGSSGYGKTFQQLDDRKHGEGDLKDCVAAKQFLISTGFVNENQIGIIGGSYGGYLVLAALAFHPEEFAVGVNIFGVANWLRTLKGIPMWWTSARESLFKEMGDPDIDEDYLKQISPLFHADKINKPLIVLQGANDPRVLKVESDEIVEAVRKKGIPVEYLIFNDEGHGFRKKENRIEAQEAILRFLDEHLRRDVARNDHPESL